MESVRSACRESGPTAEWEVFSLLAWDQRATVTAARKLATPAVYLVSPTVKATASFIHPGPSPPSDRVDAAVTVSDSPGRQAAGLIGTVNRIVECPRPQPGPPCTFSSSVLVP